MSSFYIIMLPRMSTPKAELLSRLEVLWGLTHTSKASSNGGRLLKSYKETAHLNNHQYRTFFILQQYHFHYYKWNYEISGGELLVFSIFLKKLLNGFCCFILFLYRVVNSRWCMIYNPIGAWSSVLYRTSFIRKLSIVCSCNVY